MQAQKSLFLIVNERLQYCDTMQKLQAAWRTSQPELTEMSEGSRNALIAMKDYYKKMIQDGRIHEYIQARRKAAAQFSGKKVQANNTL